MANQGSISGLKLNSIDQKVTTNGAGQNTGARVNSCLDDIVDTLTGNPVVSNGTPNPLSVFASAAQGLLAQSSLQPGDNVSELVNDAGYITSAPATLVGNLVIVDSVNGNDATGVAGDLTKPFLTLLAAQTAATSGQTILVYPGSYTSSELGKDSVNWYFMLGSYVSFSSGDGFVASSPITFSVGGRGVFDCNSGTGRFMWTNNPNSSIDIECDLVTANVIQFTAGNGRIKSNLIDIQTNIIASGGNSTVIGNIFSATASQLVNHSGGALLIKDSTMTNTNPASPCIRTSVASGISLDGVTMKPTGSAITSTTTSSIQCRGSFTTQGLGLNVTAIGDIQYDYISPAAAGQVATVNPDGTWSWA